MPVVVLTGMRQVGKTTFLQNHSGLAGRRSVTLDDFAQREAALRDPEDFLRGEEPLTIDEAQRCPPLLLAIKRAVDRRRVPGRFLLSGSANFSLLRGVAESLAGRALYLPMHPFSRREIQGVADRVPFLRGFFEKPATPRGAACDPVPPAEVLRGGMPPVALGEAPESAAWFEGFEQAYLERDLRTIGGVGDLVAFRRVLRSSAHRTAQILNRSELARDAQLNVQTASRYLGLLETSFVVSRLPAWRGARVARLIKSPKLFLADSGLAAHLAGAKDIGPGADEPLRGPLYETWLAQNLASLLSARWPEARLHYRHVQGRHEVGFVIEAGRDCLALELKAASRWEERDLGGLRSFLAAAPRCRAGVLVHNGTESVSLGDRLWALPLGLVVS